MSILTSQAEIEVEKPVELTAFLPDGYYYYISHYWDAEEIYPLIFFKDIPVFDSIPDTDTWGTYHHVYSSDGSAPLFYDFFSEEDLLNFVENGVLADTVRIREDYIDYARLSVGPITYYTNTDLIYSDTGTVYARSNPYTITTVEIVPGTETTFVGLTSDALFTGLLSEVISVIPVCIFVLVVCIGIHKGISFIFDFLKEV